MTGYLDDTRREAQPLGMEVVPEAVSIHNEVCVGIRFYNRETCLDPDLPRVAAELGRCVTCDTCQTRLETQAFTDELTGLDNRHALKLKLERLLSEDAPILFVFTDLRKFKAVNENANYGQGNRILVEVAKKMRQIVREEDGIAEGRAGGDEMIMLMQLTHTIEGPDGEPQVIPATSDEIPRIQAELAERIIRGHDEIEAFQSYNEEYGLTGRDTLGVRVGMVVIYPKDLHEEGRTVQFERLMDRADPKKHRFPWNNLG